VFGGLARASNGASRLQVIALIVQFGPLWPGWIRPSRITRSPGWKQQLARIMPVLDGANFGVFFADRPGRL